MPFVQRAEHKHIVTTAMSGAEPPLDSPGTLGVSSHLVPLPTLRGLKGASSHVVLLPARRMLTLSVEVGLDVDGDIQVWHREVQLQLLANQQGATTAGKLWNEAISKGCSGELVSSHAGVTMGRLGCSGAVASAAAAKRATMYPAAQTEGGVVGWIGDELFVTSRGDPDWTAVGATLATSSQQPARGVAIFAQVVPPSDWMKLLDELQTLSRSIGRFDPPPRINLHA